MLRHLLLYALFGRGWPALAAVEDRLAARGVMVGPTLYAGMLAVREAEVAHCDEAPAQRRRRAVAALRREVRHRDGVELDDTAAAAVIALGYEWWVAGAR